MNYSVSAWLQELGMFVPALPGWLAAIVLLFYAPAWMYLVSGILVAAFPLLVLFVFGVATTLSDPLRGTEYGATVLLVLGLVLSLTGCVAGFMQGRKNAHTPLAGGLRTGKGIGALVVAAIVLGSLVTSSMAVSAMKAASGGSYDVEPDALELTAQDYSFSPKTLEVPAGKLVETAITNADSVGHTFTCHAGDRTVDTFLARGSTGKVLVRFDEPQTIHFWRKPHSAGAEDTEEDSMWGTIAVI